MFKHGGERMFPRAAGAVQRSLAEECAVAAAAAFTAAGWAVVSAVVQWAAAFGEGR
jgi:hypothetical protein